MFRLIGIKLYESKIIYYRNIADVSVKVDNEKQEVQIYFLGKRMGTLEKLIDISIEEFADLVTLAEGNEQDAEEGELLDNGLL